MLEGCAKVWLLVILENLVKKSWFSWEVFDQMIKFFPYKGKDANNRYSKHCNDMKGHSHRSFLINLDTLSHLNVHTFC